MARLRRQSLLDGCTLPGKHAWVDFCRNAEGNISARAECILRVMQ